MAEINQTNDGSLGDTNADPSRVQAPSDQEPLAPSLDGSSINQEVRKLHELTRIRQQLTHAKQVGNTVEDPFHKAQGILRLARSETEIGNSLRAQQLLLDAVALAKPDEIKRSISRWLPLVSGIIENQIVVEDLDGAVDTASILKQIPWRDDFDAKDYFNLLSRLAEELIEVRSFEQALVVIDGIRYISIKDDILISFIGTVITAGELDFGSKAIIQLDKRRDEGSELLARAYLEREDFKSAVGNINQLRHGDARRALQEEICNAAFLGGELSGFLNVLAAIDEDQDRLFQYRARAKKFRDETQDSNRASSLLQIAAEDFDSGVRSGYDGKDGLLFQLAEDLLLLKDTHAALNVAQRIRSETKRIDCYSRILDAVDAAAKVIPDTSIDYDLILEGLAKLDSKERQAILREVVQVGPSDTVTKFLEACDEGQSELFRLEAFTLAARSGSDYFTENDLAIRDAVRTFLLSSVGAADFALTRGQVKYAFETLRACSARGLAIEDPIFQTAHLALQNPEFLRRCTPLFQFLCDLNSVRGNELGRDLICSPLVGNRTVKFFLTRLIENGHIEKGLDQWLASRSKEKPDGNISFEREREDIKLIQKVLQLGLTPSVTLLEFLLTETVSVNKRALTPDEKLEYLKGFAAEINQIDDLQELVGYLTRKKATGIAFYSIESPKTRFDLINTYTLDKFREMLSLIKGTKANREVLARFEEALRTATVSEAIIKPVIENLSKGAHPFFDSATPELSRAVRLDVSDGLQMANLKEDLSRIFGREQLGTVLRAAAYESMLGKVEDDLLTDLQKAQTLAQKQEVLQKLEESKPNLQPSAIAALTQPWDKFARDFALDISLESVFSNVRTELSPEDLLSAVEKYRRKRLSEIQRRMRVLKGEDPAIRKVKAEILKKRLAIENLKQGVGHNGQLAEKIEEIRQDISLLANTLTKLVVNSSADTKKTKKNLPASTEMEKLEKERRELKELPPAKLLLQRLLRHLAETNGFRAGVANSGPGSELFSELAAHVAGVFDLLYKIKGEGVARASSSEKIVKVRLLDKRKDLLTAVRFADSYACCFSSNQYDIEVAHGVANKNWVARIVADPLSFIFEIENETENPKVHQNIGFVHGSFGLDKNGDVVLFLNGAYLTKGRDEQGVANILQAIEVMLARPLKVKYIVIGSMHGGNISGIPGYQRKDFEGTRLRALSSPNGTDPQKRIYDDLGTQVNTECFFKNVFVKRV